MFKTKRAYKDEPRHESSAEYPETYVDDDDFTDQDFPARPSGEGLRSKVPSALSAKKRQTAAPDGETIRQQFETVRRYAAEPGVAAASQPSPTVSDEPSRLLIGRDITFKGEISDCKSLVVEGTVVANAKCASAQILESGFYDGEIEAETIEVCGRIEGHVRARGRLTIRTAGRVHGEITYGELDIEAGGQISGDIQHEPLPEEPVTDQTAVAGEPVPSPHTEGAAGEVAPFDLSEPPLPQELPSPSDVGLQVPTQTADSDVSEPSATGEPVQYQEESFSDADSEALAVGAAGDRM